MNELNIYFTDDSELAEYEATSRGYRIDVFVKIDNNFYNVRVYTMIRLRQNFDSDMKTYGLCLSEPNMILVNDSNRNEIIETIKKIYKQKYFDEIKPVENIEIDKLVKVY